MGCWSSKVPDANEPHGQGPQPDNPLPGAASPKPSPITEGSEPCRSMTSGAQLAEAALLTSCHPSRDLCGPGSHVDLHFSFHKMASANHPSALSSPRQHQPSGSSFSQSPLLATAAVFPRQGPDDTLGPGPGEAAPGRCGGVVGLEEHLGYDDDVLVQGFSSAAALPYSLDDGDGHGRFSLDTQGPAGHGGIGSAGGGEEASGGATQRLLDSVVPLLIRAFREETNALAATAAADTATPRAASMAAAGAAAPRFPVATISYPNRTLHTPTSSRHARLCGFAGQGPGCCLLPESEGTLTANATANATGAMTGAHRRPTLLRGLTRDSFVMNNTAGGGVFSGFMMRTVTAREELLHADVNWPPFHMGNPLQVSVGALLGRGGCGSVYQGEWCGRPVAIKVVQQLVAPPPGPAAAGAAAAAAAGTPLLTGTLPPLVAPLIDYFSSSSAVNSLAGGTAGGTASVDDDAAPKAAAAAAAPIATTAAATTTGGSSRTAPRLPDAHASVKRLRHPNVLRTHAYAVLSMAPQLGGVLPGRHEHHVVLELCDGGSLRAWLDRRNPELEGAVAQGPCETTARGGGGGGGCGRCGDAATAVRQALERAHACIIAGTAGGEAAVRGSDCGAAASGGGCGVGAMVQWGPPKRFQPPPLHHHHHHHHHHRHKRQQHHHHRHQCQQHHQQHPDGQERLPPAMHQQQGFQPHGHPHSGPSEGGNGDEGPPAPAADVPTPAVITARLGCSAAGDGARGNGVVDEALLADVDGEHKSISESLSKRLRGLTPAQSEQLQLLGMARVEDGRRSAVTAADGDGCTDGVGKATALVGGRRQVGGGEAWMVEGIVAGDAGYDSPTAAAAASAPEPSDCLPEGPNMAAAAAAALLGPYGGGVGVGGVWGAKALLAAGLAQSSDSGRADVRAGCSSGESGNSGSGSCGSDSCGSSDGAGWAAAGQQSHHHPRQDQQRRAAAGVTCDAAADDAVASGDLEVVRSSPSPPTAGLAAAWAEPTLLAYGNASVGSCGGGSTAMRPESCSHIIVQQHFIILGDPEDDGCDTFDGDNGSGTIYGMPYGTSRLPCSGGADGTGSIAGGRDLAMVTFGHDLRRPDGRLQQLEEGSGERQQSRGDATTSSASASATAATTASATTAGGDPSTPLRLKGPGALSSGSGGGGGIGGNGAASTAASTPLCTAVAAATAMAAPSWNPGLPYSRGQQGLRPLQHTLSPPLASTSPLGTGPDHRPFAATAATAVTAVSAVTASPAAPSPGPPQLYMTPPSLSTPPPPPPPAAVTPLQGDLDTGPITALLNRRAMDMVNSILRAAGALPGGAAATGPTAAAGSSAAAPPPPRANEPMQPAQLRHLVTALECLAEVAAGLSYLHSVGMVHGDVKSGNVLLKLDPKQPRGFVLKLADFGFSRMLEHGSHTYLSKPSGTLAYLSPELLTSYRQSAAADVYAFGLLVWEVVTAQPLFRGLQTPQLLYAKTHNADWHYLQWPAWCPPEVRLLARRCSEYQPAARLTAAEARAQVLELRVRFQDVLTRTAEAGALEALPGQR